MVNFKSSTSKQSIRRKPARGRVFLSAGRILAMASDLKGKGRGRAEAPELDRAGWDQVVVALGHEDPKVRFAAGSLLLARGEEAWPLVMGCLRGGSVAARRSALFLLGRLKVGARREGERRRHLLEGLRDEDDKIRKNAVVALGALPEAATEGALADEITRGLIAAHQTEAQSWVRSSLVLALGRCASSGARSYLSSLEGADEAEREALQTARASQVTSNSPAPLALAWTGPLEIELRGHGGLTDRLREKARRIGLNLQGPAREDSFCVRLEGGPELLWELRAMREWRIPLARGRKGRGDEVLPVVEAALEDGKRLRWLADRLGLADREIFFRIAVDGSWGRGPRRDWLRPLARKIETILPSWKNAPGGYSLEIGISFEREGLRIWLRPGRVHDPRFTYRKESLPASLQASVAAGLVELLDPAPTWRILDPCCGAGTLLAEAAAAGVRGSLVGVDRSADALRRSRVNFGGTGWSARFIEGDLGRVKVGGPFDAVLANLPFGIRVSRHEANELLYRKLFKRLEEWLVPGGRAILLSQEVGLLESCAEDLRPTLAVVERRRIAMGGLEPLLLLLRRR